MTSDVSTRIKSQASIALCLSTCQITDRALPHSGLGITTNHWAFADGLELVQLIDAYVANL